MKRPGSRSGKQPLPALEYPPGFNERWFLEWFEFGWQDLLVYTARHLAFARYYDTHKGDS